MIRCNKLATIEEILTNTTKSNPSKESASYTSRQELTIMATFIETSFTKKAFISILTKIITLGAGETIGPLGLDNIIIMKELYIKGNGRMMCKMGLVNSTGRTGLTSEDTSVRDIKSQDCLHGPSRINTKANL